MKTIITILLISYFHLFSFGQKKELYVNDDFEYISKTEFNKKSEQSLNYNLRFKLDSIYLNVKVLRSKKGKIKLKILDSIKNVFYVNKTEKFSDNDIFLINYYPGKGKCSSIGYKSNFKSKYNQFRKKFDKIENLKQLFIYKSKRGLKGFGNKIDWKSDINRLIEKTFYPIHYPCGGYVIIDSKGNYISKRGEYCYWEGMINKINKFANKNYKIN
ncbi:hypothetical protein PG911_08910 [Tenacibaculum ovolyticum]|uniref:hypothetical protein n=1 Tax=Tenacibaculum ovolyticum TaxID=104270 RepID=UPI0022F3B92B|nr:hypothetical protein [Tenacibaculum ovolyticum]WBX78366.1 hypothetical protein PG911_08910 [Tenacibaculum ovolyticum]